MRRDLPTLGSTTFDLLVVGAGIHGACIAWDASLRGLSVALIDQADFGGATSANSLRIVHGGLRYLARADFPRMLESIRERSALLRIAPALVEPLPVLIPIYGGVSQNRVGLGAALLLNDVISYRRNRGLRTDRAIPRGRLVSRDECLRMFPYFPHPGLRAGALWYDARLRHPERLTLSFVRSAAETGAVPANYVRVDRLLVQDGRAQGALVTDLERGSQFEIKARTVVVASGPWTSEVLAGTLGKAPAPVQRALAVNIRIDRALANVAVGVQSRTGADQDPVGGGNRFVFAAPQNGNTLLGTWYAPAQGSTVAAEVDRGVQSLVREFNQACPGLDLSITEVTGRQWGLLPLEGEYQRGTAARLAERPTMVDHGVSDSVRHLLSVEGVKYTTARSVAQQVVNWVFRDLERVSPRCQTAEVRVDAAEDGSTSADGTVDRNDIHRIVHQEMALNLSDIVFRRTSLASAGPLSRAGLAQTARLAAAELGWDTLRQEAEIEEVLRQTGVPLPVGEPVG